VTQEIEHAAAPQPRLRDRAIRAGAWTIGAYGSDLAIRLLSNLILTRLLFPDAFGVVAASSALISGLVLVSDFGIRAVVVQSTRGDQAGFLWSVWVFQLGRGVLLWLALVGVCALLGIPAVRNLLPDASVFASPSFPLITGALGFSLVLGGAESTSIPLNMRHLNYRPIVLINLASKIASLPIILIWAWFAPSVWALIGGAVAGGFVRLVLSHTSIPGPRMSLKWEKDDFREIVRFGRWIIVSSMTTFISAQWDVILLGIIAPGSVLGLYSIAKLLSAVGEGLLDQLNVSLALPILSEVVRKSPRDVRDRYYRFRLPIDLAAGLQSGGLFVAGSFIVNFLYDPRYAGAGLMLQLLALGTLSYPSTLIGSAFTATGETHINAFISIMRALSLIACMALGFVIFGVNGAVGGVAVHRILPSGALLLVARQRDWIGIWEELRVVPAFVAGVLIGKMGVLAAGALGIENIHQLLHR
jgi:O-antigen/teichoic acid export membrane protein